MSEERAFRGIWIPADIWLSRDLSIQEKVMLVEIDSLQSPTRGCYKSNRKLAEFFQLSANRVSEIISSLAKKGWIRVEQVREGKQIVERRIFMATPFDKPTGGDRNPEGGYSENRENPSRNPEEGYSENCEERGSGLRGSSLSDAREDQHDIFAQAARRTDDGDALPNDERQQPMTLDWVPEPNAFAAQCQRRGLPADTEYTSADLADFTAHFADQPKRMSNAAWTNRFARWVDENRQRQQVQQQTQPTGGAHANRQQRNPRRRLSAAEARARDRALARGEQPGDILDGECSPG